MVTTTAREENGEFCVAVGPVPMTAGMLTQLVKGAGCQMADLEHVLAQLGLTLAVSKRQKGMNSHITDLVVCVKSFFFLLFTFCLTKE